MKSQISFPIKVSIVILSIVAFMLVIYYYTSFTSEIKKEKASVEFRGEVLGILEKLVNSEECLAYSGFVKSSKPVLDISKIEEFVVNYKDKEPDCARSTNFDYSVKIIQLPKEIKTYPGEIIQQTECGEAELSFSFHSDQKEQIKNHYVVCDISEEDLEKCCKAGKELDFNAAVQNPKISCNGKSYNCALYDCSKYVIDATKSDENKEECQLKILTGEKVCCIYKNCLRGIGPHPHPIIIKCYNLDPETDCKKTKSSDTSFQMWCGSVAIPVKVPTPKSISVNVQEKIWVFSVSSGISSFSPEKAKWEEIEISYPIVIRYNETFSTEGIIKIKAVRGELEKFVGILENICKKAENREDIYFADKFYFSYNVKREGNKICMLDKCKIIDCQPDLIFDGLEKGEYYLKIIYDKGKNEVRVVK